MNSKGVLFMRGGFRKGSGRKKGSKNNESPVSRKVVKQIRWTHDEWDKVFNAAGIAGKKPSTFIRETTLKQIKEDGL